MSDFFGRAYEINQLENLMKRKSASAVVIKGRRRIGKSRLAAEFAKDKVFISFSGIAPVPNVTAQDQRDEFATQFCKTFKTPPLSFTDWSHAFDHVTQYITDKPTVILLDEISWMGSQDPTFIPKLKNWWDLTLQNYPNLMLIFCGSISTWIEDNIINSTAFFGRISLYLDVEELSLAESYQLLNRQGITLSAYEIFKILAVTGGVPWYLKQIEMGQSADENIRRLCFQKEGILVKEFHRIFHDLFADKGTIYQKIVQLLGEGMKDLPQIRMALHYPQGTALGRYLHNLTVSGYVTQHYSWSFDTEKIKKQSLYRLSDNYLRFYLKYIEPNLPKITSKGFKNFTLNDLPGWEVMMGFQVESLLLKNRHLLLEALGVPPQEVVGDNPYVQKTTLRKKGCQIDYLIQTHAHNLFACEFKFKKKEIGVDIVDYMKEKLGRFSKPRNFGVAPVLCHLSGVSDAVHNARYFYRIIDITDFLGRGLD